MEFKVGDRVKCIGVFDGKGEAVGKNGSVIDVCGGSGVTVEFDEYVDGHNGSTKNGKNGYCWNFSYDAEKYLELIPASNKILITSDGHTTTARLYDGKKVVKSARADCCAADTFDFATGAKLAFDRLMGTDKPKGWNGKVVCVETHDVGFVAGAIYSVIDGALRDKDGEFRPNRSGAAFFRQFDDLNSSAYGKFIEFKGEADER